MLRYRPNVALILTRSGGQILVCERCDFANGWQFPQGGVQPGETAVEALRREVGEEISLGPEDYRILSYKGPYRYEFRPGFRKEGCDGQEQTYFLAEFLGGPDHEFHLDQKEFRAFRWIDPRDFRITWVPPIKREVYRGVFLDFFDVRLP